MSRKMLVLILTLIISVMLFNVASGVVGAAKVVTVRGKAFHIDGAKGRVPLKDGDTVVEGNTVETEKRSMASLVLSDSSKITIGPSSKMSITAAPSSGNVGVISLLEGVIRSQVEKNSNPDGKSKMLIKTKTAAMGVRGTDYEIFYYPETKITNTITYSGEVKMVDTSTIDKYVKLAMVKEGIDAKELAEVSGYDIVQLVSSKMSARKGNSVEVLAIESALNDKAASSIGRGKFSSIDPTVSKFVFKPAMLNKSLFHLRKLDNDFSEQLAGSAKESGGDSNGGVVKSIVPQGMAPSSAVVEGGGDMIVGSSLKESVNEELGIAKGGDVGEGAAGGDKVAIADGAALMSGGKVVVPNPATSFRDPVTGAMIDQSFKFNKGELDLSSGGRDPASGEGPKFITMNDLKNSGQLGENIYQGATLRNDGDMFAPPPMIPIEFDYSVVEDFADDAVKVLDDFGDIGFSTVVINVVVE